VDQTPRAIGMEQMRRVFGSGLSGHGRHLGSGVGQSPRMGIPFASAIPLRQSDTQRLQGTTAI